MGGEFVVDYFSSNLCFLFVGFRLTSLRVLSLSFLAFSSRKEIVEKPYSATTTTTVVYSYTIERNEIYIITMNLRCVFSHFLYLSLSGPCNGMEIIRPN